MMYIISKSIPQQELTLNKQQFFFFFLAFHSKHLLVVQVLLLIESVVILWNLHEMRKINFSQEITQSVSFARRSAPLMQFLLEGSCILSQGYSSLDIVSNVELVDSSFNCSFISSFSLFVMCVRKFFHSVCRFERWHCKLNT